MEKHHIVVLYTAGQPAHRIVKYAVKLLKGELVSFTATNLEKGEKQMILIDLDHIDQKDMEVLQHHIKSNGLMS